MDLLLTSLSSQYIHMPLAPFCLKKAVEERFPALDVAIADLNINMTHEELLEKLLAEQPRMIGFAVYIWNRSLTAALIRRIKAVSPETIVAVGGPEVSWSVEESFREMPCDAILRGAGEESFPLLVDCLLRGGSPAGIPGVCLPGGGIADPAPTPAPRGDLYDDAWQEQLKGRMAYVETSRGCPFSCAFCLSGQHDRLAFLPADEALALLIRLGQSGTDTVKIIDRTFNCIKERTDTLLRGLIAAKERGDIGQVCYHMEVEARLFDDGTISILNSAPPGLFQMEAGLQSFHPETLIACRRSPDLEKLTGRLRRILQKNNIHMHIDLIAGLPEEDFATFCRSVDQACALQPHQLQVGFLKLLHGSSLRAYDWGQRYSPDPPYEVLSTPWLSFDEITRLRHMAEAVEKLMNSGRFRRTLALIFDRTALTPSGFYLMMGEKLAAQGRMSHDRLSELLYRTCLELGIPADDAVCAMILDRLATDNTGFLPAFLPQDNEKRKAAARRFRDSHPHARNPRVALLPDGRTAAAVWTEKHPVTGQGEILFPD